MAEKIIKLFFNKVSYKGEKRVTILKNRKGNFDRYLRTTKRNIKNPTNELTCLSEYFVGIKGLNAKERF